MDILFGAICFIFGIVAGIIVVWGWADRTVDLVVRNVFREQSERAWKRCDKLDAQLESFNKYNDEDQLVAGPRWWTNRMDALKIDIEVLEARIGKYEGVAEASKNLVHSLSSPLEPTNLAKSPVAALLFAEELQRELAKLETKLEK